MIDPHVHLRDWRQAAKETLRRGLSVAWRAGLDGVFEMPITDPPLTDRQTILRRIDDADAAAAAVGARIFHGVFAGVTPDPAQLEEAVRSWKDLFPRVVGLKMFAGHSTGNMGITGKDAQARIYARLAGMGYDGVLAVHAEKEECFRRRADGSLDWDPRVPSSHAHARPPEAEVESVRDQIDCARAAGFKGTLHIVHVSVPAALDLIRAARTAGQAVTCGLTPHHALLDSSAMDGPAGALLRMNPPLRPAPMPRVMLARLMAGEVDWIETDHAPHTMEDKVTGHASGIPCLPFHPRFIRLLRERGMPEHGIGRATHGAIVQAFGIDIPDRGREPDGDLAREYPFDPFR